MTWIESIIKKKDNALISIDNISIDGKNINEYIPIWQIATYIGMFTYFLLMLVFEESDHPYISGLYQFPELLKEIFFSDGTHTNIILNRGLDNGGHILAYMSLLFCALVCRLYLPKTIEGFYYSILIPAFALSISEGTFNIIYYAVYYPLYPHITWDIFILTNPLAIFYIFTIMIGIFVTPVTRYLKLDYLIGAIVIIMFYFAVWSLIGLPVTLSTVNYLLTGNLNTQYFSNLTVNALEIIQWYVASITFIWAVMHCKTWYGMKPARID